MRLMLRKDVLKISFITFQSPIIPEALYYIPTNHTFNEIAYVLGYTFCIYESHHKK